MEKIKMIFFLHVIIMFWHTHTHTHIDTLEICLKPKHSWVWQNAINNIVENIYAKSKQTMKQKEKKKKTRKMCGMTVAKWNIILFNIFWLAYLKAQN